MHWDFGLTHKLLNIAAQSLRDTKKGHPKMTLRVIRLGFEPRTPTLKVLCSTN